MHCTRLSVFEQYGVVLHNLVETERIRRFTGERKIKKKKANFLTIV